MSISKFAKDYHEKMFPGYQSDFLRTDPEFIERFDNFAFDEVIHQGSLDDKTRFMAILATLLGCQGIDEFRAMVPAALNFGVTPVEIKESMCGGWDVAAVAAYPAVVLEPGQKTEIYVVKKIGQKTEIKNYRPSLLD